MEPIYLDNVIVVGKVIDYIEKCNKFIINILFLSVGLLIFLYGLKQIP